MARAGNSRAAQRCSIRSKDIAALVNKVKHRDGRSFALAAVATLGSLLAERLTYKPDKLNAVK